ncbi:MAG TPA: hypothetical protein VKW04_06625 [Planctomycetota bacterium]|jgi:hypothetical protein|nr:hypothetical protein [Planctomycetota bacterium]
MGDDKKKKGGMLKKIGILLGLVGVVWVGYFGYAKATHQEPTCIFTVLYNKLK